LSNHFTHFLSDGKKIKVEIYLREIKSNSNSGLIVQSNDISETLKHINTIEVQNAKLKNIAWTQSHVVRAPLSRILGIIDLIEGETENFSEMLFWLKAITVSTNEMDGIVRELLKKQSELKRIR
jgi:light-regulated signal transduction histidine kinase (bacteriophytochrome)